MEKKTANSTSNKSSKSTAKKGIAFENNLVDALEINLPIENFHSEVINIFGKYSPILFQLRLNWTNEKFIKCANPLQTEYLEWNIDSCFTFRNYEYKANLLEGEGEYGEIEIYVQIQTGENEDMEFFDLYLNEKNEFYSDCWYFYVDENDNYFIQIFNTSKLIFNKVRYEKYVRSYFNWRKYHCISRRFL